ncbi:MAG: SCP2 sterol-binding domain-containing protein [Anaerolineales bacterium]|nr:SCP2 sterol-binding domain-containing protein [Anaerolineales bacterium]
MNLSELENWSLEELLYRAPDFFNPEEAEGVDLSVQFILSGRESGTWCMRIADSCCRIEKGGCMRSDVTLKADSEDVRQIMRGEINPLQILLRGLIQVEGDRSAALQLGKYFTRVEFN